MAILLGLDFETTGLDPLKDYITEVGGVLWDTERNTMLESFSYLVSYQFPIAIANEVVQLNGIDPEMIDSYGTGIDLVKHNLFPILNVVDYFVAHNAAFEKVFFPQISEKHLSDTVWIDTKTDLPYSPGKGYGSLTHIAADHGFLNPFPHRALFDAMTMMQVLSKYDFAEVERNALAPVRTLAIVSKYDPSGETQRKARALGYYRNGAARQYRKPVKDFRVADEMAATTEAGLNCVLLESDEVTP